MLYILKGENQTNNKSYSPIKETGKKRGGLYIFVFVF
jgi:hypothetical protein